MYFLLGKRAYLECDHHLIELCCLIIDTKKEVYGCLHCGARYYSKEEAIKRGMDKNSVEGRSKYRLI